MRNTMGFDQTRPWLTGSLQAMWRGRNNTGFNKSAVTASSFSTVGQLSILLVLFGSGLQGYANNTFDACFVAFLLLLAGILVVSLFSLGKKSELRAFLLTYGVCVFVGGMAQFYSLSVFHDPQSTIDSFTFFQQISPQPPFTTLAEISPFNIGLAVVFWEQAYKLAWWMGFEFGPYIGVMFNALVMGFTASLTVRTARELFGNDDWRLRRVGTLFAFCGLFILFGAILLRDCFTTFFNALVLWGIVRWLVRPTPRNLLLAITLTVVSAYAMLHLRIEAVLLFGPFWFLAFFSWYFAKRLDKTRLVAAFFALCVLLITSSYLLDYFQMYQEIQANRMEFYAELSAEESVESSLAMRLVINQPLPIRLVLGSGSLLINPIPLWVNFKIGSLEYHWIKGYNGIYQVLILPLVIAGFLAIFHLFQRDRKRAMPLLFLAVYLLLNLAAVVLTSLESRHLAQFMPAFIILAALTNTREKKVRKDIQAIAIWCFSVVVVVHLAWAIMQGIS